VDLPLNAPTSNVNRNAARVREVLRLEAEDGNTAFLQLGYYRGRV
jgi:hypothetical protein